MPAILKSRRNFLSNSALAAGGAAAALADPSAAAAQRVNVKPGDLPDLTIKEVKVYVINRPAMRQYRAPGAPPVVDRFASIVTESGIEGNYTLGNRYFHPNWSNQGWLEFAKRTLPGKSVLDLPRLTAQWEPDLRRQGRWRWAVCSTNWAMPCLRAPCRHRTSMAWWSCVPKSMFPFTLGSSFSRPTITANMFAVARWMRCVSWWTMWAVSLAA